jgi:aminopeptidase N
MRFLLLSLLCCMVMPKLCAEKPFDLASTPGKLPKSVVPREYAIRIIPNLDKLTFTGSETVKIDVLKPATRVVLNALELEVAKVNVDGEELAASAIKLDPKEETLTLTLPKELPVGQHALALSFSGKINQPGQGLYYARYAEQGTSAQKIMLGTQFEASDARRMFPCWDEPSFRARFQLTAVVPENFLAISNMPVESENKIAAGKEVRFEMTPSMASYLNVFVAGELEFVEGKSGNTKIRVITTKNKSEMGRYALEATDKILQYYNDYFGLPYPLPKLDQIAVPGGFGGAMENWGGITYYETAVLFDPATSSDATRQTVFQVIAHEMAHQWFGDLVTMAWWDNIWLNEGFASWIGSKCTAHFNPQWDVWLRMNTPRDPSRRIGFDKETAMEGDARSTTHPIQQEIANEAEANSAFDDITYKKGESFIRMLESFLGPDVFRDGIRKYIAAHQYSNATTADLWKALADASGKPVADVAAAWTEQPGFPLITVTRGTGAKIELAQERFTVHFPQAPPLQWDIPVTYQLVGAPAGSLLMTKKTEQIPNVPADQAMKLNVDGAGNYRVQYDTASWKLLLGTLHALSAADRVNLLSDAWALVQANRAPLSQYLHLISKLPVQAELAEREQIMNTFEKIDQLLIGTDAQASFEEYARSVLRPVFDTLGWKPKKEEPARISTLRADLVKTLGFLDDKTIIAGCRERFQKYLHDPTSLPPDLRLPVFEVVGRYADETAWSKLHGLGRKTTNIEEKQIYYEALSQTHDPKLIRRALQIALTDELPTSRALHMVTRVARDSGHPEIAWDFAKTHMKELLAKADALGVLRYAPSLFTFFSDPARITELQTYAQKNLRPESKKAVAQAVDEIGFRADLKKLLLAQAGAWKNSSGR